MRIADECILGRDNREYKDSVLSGINKGIIVRKGKDRSGALSWVCFPLVRRKEQNGGLEQ